MLSLFSIYVMPCFSRSHFLYLSVSLSLPLVCRTWSSSKKTDGGRNPAIEGMNSSTMRTPGDRAYSDERPGDFQFAATSPGVSENARCVPLSFRILIYFRSRVSLGICPSRGGGGGI